MIKKWGPDATKLYILQENKSVCAFCSLLYALLLICDKISADHFKDEMTPLIKSNDGLKFSQYMEFNHVIEKGKPLWKISYKLLKEEDR